MSLSITDKQNFLINTYKLSELQQQKCKAHLTYKIHSLCVTQSCACDILITSAGI